MASPFSDQGNSIDSYIQNTAPTTNYGTSILLLTGEASNINRFLIKWDLSSIPSNAIVSSAVLSIYVNSDYSNNARTLSAYRVLRVWTEAGVTWNKYDGSNDWGTAGCSNTTSDREATDIGNASVGANPVVGSEIAITLTASKVQEWISGSLTNNGLLLKVDTENADSMWYHSHEGTTANLRPKLVITYTLGGGPKTVLFI